MAALAYQQAQISGTTLTFVAATGGAGDTVPVNDHGAVIVKNGAASAITVTVAVPGNTKYGLANPDPTITVAAGAQAAFGPFPVDLADPNDALVHFTYSSATSVTVAALTN